MSATSSGTKKLLLHKNVKHKANFLYVHFRNSDTNQLQNLTDHFLSLMANFFRNTEFCRNQSIRTFFANPARNETDMKHAQCLRVFSFDARCNQLIELIQLC